MKKLIALFLACIFSLSLVACGNNSGNNGAGNGGNTGDGGDGGDTITVKIACVMPLTGDYAEYGAQALNACEMAAEEWNEKKVQVDGKTVVFEIASYDDAGKADEGAAIAEQIVSDDSIIAIAADHYQSAVSLVASPTYQNAGILAIANGASHPDLTKIGPYVCRNNVTDLGESRNAMQMLYRMGYKRIAITAPETDFGVSSSAYDQEIAEELAALGEDIEVVAVEFFADLTDDYSAVISNLTAAEPDVILNLGTYNQVAPFCIQARRAGVECDIMAVGNALDDNLIVVGGDSVEGVAMPSLFNAATELEPAASFVDRFYEYTDGSLPNHIGSLTYDSASYIMYLVEQTGSIDRQTIMEAAHEIPMEGVTGTIVFDEENECPKVQVVLQVQDGEFVEVPNFLTTWDEFIAELGG